MHFLPFLMRPCINPCIAGTFVSVDYRNCMYFLRDCVRIYIVHWCICSLNLPAFVHFFPWYLAAFHPYIMHCIFYVAAFCLRHAFLFGAPFMSLCIQSCICWYIRFPFVAAVIHFLRTLLHSFIHRTLVHSLSELPCVFSYIAAFVYTLCIAFFFSGL